MTLPRYTHAGTDSLFFWPAIILLAFTAFLLFLTVVT